MVSGQADGAVRPRPVDAGVGFRAVPDEVAEAPELLAVARFDLLEYRIECLAVAVDV